MDRIELMRQALFQMRAMGAWTQQRTNQWRNGISAVQMRCEWERELINRGNCRDQFIQLNLHFVCISESDIHQYARAPRDTVPRGRSHIYVNGQYNHHIHVLIRMPHHLSFDYGCKRAGFYIYLSIEYLIRIELN